MTRDERIEAIRKLAARHPDPTTWLTGDINFLLSELDAAEARVQRFTDALWTGVIYALGRAHGREDTR